VSALRVTAALSAALLMGCLLEGCASGPKTVKAASLKPDKDRHVAPDFALKDADGRTVHLAEYKGKVVLLDFWATWCGPCVAMLPQMAKIYQEGKDKGLVLLGVDQDEDAATAASFLAKKGYAWANFHDGDGEIEKLMGPAPLPRVVLVDAQGQIVYDGMGMNEKQLRTQLARLGPEFAEMAPKPEPAPCPAAK